MEEEEHHVHHADAAVSKINEKEVAIAAVTNDGKALESLSEILQKDKEVVMAAVANYGQALK